jgi:hypothetical protein
MARKMSPLARYQEWRSEKADRYRDRRFANELETRKVAQKKIDARS